MDAPICGKCNAEYEGICVEHPAVLILCNNLRESQKNKGISANAEDVSINRWLRNVNSSVIDSCGNLIEFQYKGQIYYKTPNQIKKGSELTVWCDDDYAEELDLQTNDYFLYERGNRRLPVTEQTQDHDLLEDLINYKYLECEEKIRPFKEDCATKQNARKYLFECDTCRKKFNNKSNLNRHNRIHTGSTPYVCEICGKKCNQKYALQYHMKKHTGEKPFRCVLCEKMYKSKSDLTKHMQIHW